MPLTKAHNRMILGSAAKVEDFGAVGDGVTDDTAAIQAAIDAEGVIDMSGGHYLISDTITIPSNRVIDFADGRVTSTCSGVPLFRFGDSSGASSSGLTMRGGKATISGSGTAFLELLGSSDFGISPSNYARQINLEGLHLSITGGNTFDRAIHCKTAARQIFMDGCLFFTKSGIESDGKTVEVHISNSIIFSSTAGASGTFGIKTRSSLGTNLFNEGFHITNCTIDAFETTFDIADIFVLCVTNSFIDARNGKVFSFIEPTTTTHTQDIKVSNCVIGISINGTAVQFGPNTGGRSFYADFVGNTFLKSRFVVSGNSSAISLRDSRFVQGSGTAPNRIGITIADNCSNLTFDGIDFTTNQFDAGVVMSGSTGANIAFRNFKYNGGGSTIFSTRPVTLQNIDLGDGTTSMSSDAFVSPTTYAAGATMVTAASPAFAKGDRGRIVGTISFYGADATLTGITPNQRFDIGRPGGFDIPSAAGQNSAFIYPLMSSGTITINIPFTCTSDISTGNVTVTNATGNTITVPYHSYISVVRE